MGKYKLIEGSPGKYNNWYLTPRHRFRMRYPRRNVRRNLQLTQLFDIEGNEFQILIDVFFQRRNSMQIATLLMIGHALLSANFSTLQTHLPRRSRGSSGLISQRLGDQIPVEVREAFNF